MAIPSAVSGHTIRSVATSARQGARQSWSGAGVLVSANLVLATKHGTPIEADRTWIECAMGDRRVAARTFHHRHKDVAGLWFRRKVPRIEPLIVSDDWTPERGEKIYIINGPQIFESAVETTVSEDSYYAEHVGRRGDSGSAVYNEEGHLVGIVYGAMYKEGVFIVSPDIVYRFVASLKRQT